MRLLTVCLTLTVAVATEARAVDTCDGIYDERASDLMRSRRLDWGLVDRPYRAQAWGFCGSSELRRTPSIGVSSRWQADRWPLPTLRSSGSS